MLNCMDFTVVLKIGFGIALAGYLLCALVVFVYALNCYVLMYLFSRRCACVNRKNDEFIAAFQSRTGDAHLPVVTTQLPVYNERNVIERLVEAVAALDYPLDRHEIQILDDSTDETSGVIRAMVARLNAEGHDIKHVRRGTREGFKAGALQYGLDRCRGDYIAIFDADFVPPKDFLRKTVPFLVERPNNAAVQTRWTHLNQRFSWLTAAQAIALDSHFAIGQGARSWNDLYMNFNGTAGVWRKNAIVAIGGWHSDTLTEDMDLSYRAQIEGWKIEFVFNITAPAELPMEMNAFKSQQYRWAKGALQVGIKLLPRIIRSNDPLIRKFEAVMHLTNNAIYPCMLVLMVFAVPLLYAAGRLMPPWGWLALLCVFLASTMAPSSLHMYAQRMVRRDWWKQIPYLPWLMCIGAGLAVNNTRAVIEALVGIKSGFVRTPKRGAEGTSVPYRIRADRLVWLELALGVYSLVAFVLCVHESRWLFSYFMLVNTIGLLYVSVLSFAENRARQPCLASVGA